MADVVRCTVCGVSVKAENEAAHMGKAHPTASFHPSERATRPARKDALYVSPRTKKAIFAIVAAAVLLAAGVILAGNLGRIKPLDPNATLVHISMAGWDPPTLTTSVGTPLKLDVMAMDDAHGAGHDFRIDPLGVNEYVGSGQIVFTLPANAPGTYTFYCSLCCGGLDSPSMVGTFVVNA